MSVHTSGDTANRQVLQEAADWFVEMDAAEVPVRTRQAFDLWLRRSPEHVRAFMELLPLWEEAGREGQYQPAADLIARCLESGTSNVVHFEKQAGGGEAALRGASTRVETTVGAGACGGTTPARPRLFDARRLVGAAAAVVVGVGVLAWTNSQRGLITTRIGEQRSLTLEDGSSVELNARSRIRVHLAASERTVDLLEGQAIFQVARDPARPFIVRSGRVQVRALGTQFDVNRGLRGTTVTVLEGRVAVSSGSAAAEAGSSPNVELSVGEQLKIAAVTTLASVLPKPKLIDVTEASDWTRHRLSFQKATLAEVVEEFNRYNRRQLRIDSPDLQTYLISATFSSTDPTSLLRFLRTRTGVQVTQVDDAVHITATNTDQPP